MRFLDPLVLSAIDKAFENWEPSPYIHEHLTKSHALTKSIIVSCICVFIGICRQIHHFIQLLVSFV